RRLGVGGTQYAISFGANASRISNTRAPALLYVAKIFSSLWKLPGRFSCRLWGPKTPAAQKLRSLGVGNVEIGTGFSGARTSTRNVQNVPLAHISALASSATTTRLRPGKGSGVCVPPGNGGDQLMRESSLGFFRSVMSCTVSPPSRQAP